jgi:hypothetical protein
MGACLVRHHRRQARHLRNWAHHRSGRDSLNLARQFLSALLSLLSSGRQAQGDEQCRCETDTPYTIESPTVDRE